MFERFGFQSGRTTDKFAGYNEYVAGENGLYYITEGTNSYISVKVFKTEDLGSHTMFIGEITDMKVLNDITSMTYKYYLDNIKPKPKAVGVTDEGQTVWRCTVCGYEYVGEELPENFICPLCKQPASVFEKIIKNVKKKDTKDEKIEELTDRVKRQMAEFDNFRKRTEKEKSTMYEMGAKDIIERMLPVVDNFERGLASIPESEKNTAFAEGMEKIYKQFQKVLEDAGVKAIEAAGYD